MNTGQRTLPISCPRCGAAVVARIYRVDVHVMANDVSTYSSGPRDLMRGLEADVTLRAEHAC